MKNWKKEFRFKDKAEDKLEVRLENAKTRRIVTWIFEILGNFVFCHCSGNHDVSVCDHAGKVHMELKISVCRRTFFS